ncbi:YncE family protein [Paremcibacter congregatus]|nr:hypothetical protein [Paremcibacter congregatus]
MKLLGLICAGLATLGGMTSPAQAEILAMMLYETKSADSLKTLKLSGVGERREGILIMDVDPASAQFGAVMWDMPLANDTTSHHIFYDRTMTKGYITALTKRELGILDMTKNPYRRTTIPMPDCGMGEDVTFNEKNTRWYLTCMDSSTIIVGDVKTDKVIEVIQTPGVYPHGLAVNSKINRILATSTVKGDMTNPGETIIEIDATTHEILGSHKLSLKPSPSGEAPVEILFVPGAKNPIAYITNMFGNTLWTATWDKASRTFKTEQVFDFATENAGVPLEIYFNKAVDTMYVTSASPGFLHIFDVSKDKGHPKLIKSIKTGQGSHHIAFTKDEKMGFVQNSLLNLPGMSEGTINVVDLEKQEVISTIDTLVKMGMNPNVIVLLPENNAFAGH